MSSAWCDCTVVHAQSTDAAVAYCSLECPYVRQIYAFLKICQTLYGTSDAGCVCIAIHAWSVRTWIAHMFNKKTPNSDSHIWVKMMTTSNTKCNMCQKCVAKHLSLLLKICHAGDCPAWHLGNRKPKHNGLSSHLQAPIARPTQPLNACDIAAHVQCCWGSWTSTIPTAFELHEVHTLEWVQNQSTCANSGVYYRRNVTY